MPLAKEIVSFVAQNKTQESRSKMTGLLGRFAPFLHTASQFFTLMPPALGCAHPKA